MKTYLCPRCARTTQADERAELVVCRWCGWAFRVWLVDPA